MASRAPHAPLHSHGHILAHDEEAFTGNDDHIYEPHYTVLIRVPVNRGDFIDPQPVCAEVFVLHRSRRLTVLG